MKEWKNCSTATIYLLLSALLVLITALSLLTYYNYPGGNIAANCVLRRQPVLKGLIDTAAYFKLAYDLPGWKVALFKIMAKILPALTLPTKTGIGCFIKSSMGS